MDPHPPDAALLARQLAAAGDPAEVARLLAQVDALFAAHQDLVYAACLRFVGRPELAREVAQETLLVAYQRLSTFRGEARFGTWLVSIARYQCLNALRKQRDVLAEDGLIEARDPAGSVLSALRRQEREELLRASAEAVLDPVEQEAVYLRYTENLPVERITEVLHLETASGARGLLQRCKRKLQAEIRRRLEGMDQGSSFVRGSLEG